MKTNERVMLGFKRVGADTLDRRMQRVTLAFACGVLIMLGSLTYIMTFREDPDPAQNIDILAGGSVLGCLVLLVVVTRQLTLWELKRDFEVKVLLFSMVFIAVLNSTMFMLE